VLFLWRSLATDSGGAGLHRGGAGLDAAWTVWGADSMVGITNAAAWQIPVPGVKGGYPGGGTEYRRVRKAQLAWSGEAGEPLPSREGLPPGEPFQAKSTGVDLRIGDVWRQRFPGGGGWGDPLDRSPAAVVADVKQGAVSAHAAREAYGVVLGATGDDHDAAATERQREHLRGRRLQSAPVGQSRLQRRTQLSLALARFGAFVEPRAEAELIETFDGETGAVEDVRHFVATPAHAFPEATLRVL
jgi:N-methylhydantoinase B